jgi:hypothetical protein
LKLSHASFLQTGTGFIKVEKPNGSGFDAQTIANAGCVNHACYKSNPATNDWLPSPEMVRDGTWSNP